MIFPKVEPCFEGFLERFKEKNGKAEQVNVATSDMIHGYLSALGERLGQLLQVEYLDTVQAYSYRLELQDSYETHKAYDEDMLSAFERLAIRFANSAVMEIRKFAQCLTRNAVEILNYFQTLRTNAILEGFNSKISIIKSRARGFRNMRNFMNMIYFVC